MKRKLELWIAEFHYWRLSRKLRQLVKENDRLRQAAGLAPRDWSTLSRSTRQVLGTDPERSRSGEES